MIYVSLMDWDELEWFSYGHIFEGFSRLMFNYLFFEIFNIIQSKVSDLVTDEGYFISIYMVISNRIVFRKRLECLQRFLQRISFYDKYLRWNSENIYQTLDYEKNKSKHSHFKSAKQNINVNQVVKMLSWQVLNRVSFRNHSKL